MLSRRVYLILGDRKDLGNKLHSHYIYSSPPNVQAESRTLFSKLLNDYSDNNLREIAYDKITQELIEELIALRSEPNWMKVVRKFSKGMIDLLDRELKKGRAIRKPKTAAKNIRKEMRKLHIHHPLDTLKVEEKVPGTIIVNYVSELYSPERCDEFVPWRDTQCDFALSFKKDLFIWYGLSVHSSLRGRGIGTNLARSVENMAHALGFSRFSVEYPNRTYWTKKMGYTVPYRYRIGSGRYQYTLEGYKELSS